MEKKKAGRKSVPDAEKAVKVTITLKPDTAQFLKARVNASALVERLLKAEMNKEG